MIPTPEFVYEATVVSVHDGDTYHLRVDLGFRVSTTLAVRLRGVDTPELTSDLGKGVAAQVRQLLMASPQVRIKSYKDRQSFARWVCDVWIKVDARGWVPLAEHIIAQGWGSPMER